MVFCYFLAASNSERITKCASKAKEKDQTKQRFAWNWVNSLKHFNISVSKNMQNGRFQVWSSPVLGSAWVRIYVQCSQRDRRGFGFRLVIYVYFREASGCGMKALINEKKNLKFSLSPGFRRGGLSWHQNWAARYYQCWVLEKQTNKQKTPLSLNLSSSALLVSIPWKLT